MSPRVFLKTTNDNASPYALTADPAERDPQGTGVERDHAKRATSSKQRAPRFALRANAGQRDPGLCSAVRTYSGRTAETVPRSDLRRERASGPLPKAAAERAGSA